MDLAPVIIFTFNRLQHTKKTIKALQKNELADKTEIFIFSDGPRCKEDEVEIKKVREYISNLSGFKRVKLIKSQVNKGLAKSVIDGVTQIINKYGKVIVLEDDLITSKYFLTYMNESLNCYQDRMDIWSISGYSPNIDIPNNYIYDVYLTGRGSSWGWATWSDRWMLNDWNIIDYEEFKKNLNLKKAFNNSGSDMSPMLNDQMEGRINSWAIRWCYNQFKEKKLTIYPRYSLVDNIGNDLSGTHTSITNKYKVDIKEIKINIEKNIEINHEIIDKFKKFYDLDFMGYIAIIIKKVGLYRIARKMRNKIIKIVGVK